VTIAGANAQSQFTSGTSGQFGFLFEDGAGDTFYGWGSLVIESPNPGGYYITEAYYNTVPGTGINVGAVPQIVPEPSSMALLGLGAAGVAAWRARRKVKAATEAEA